MSIDALTEPVLAAGAVCWRDAKSGPEILLITRSRHNDVSLPKGKVDPGETIPEAAVREIREETGFRVTLGVPLGVSEYILPGGRDKAVYYWAAEVTRSELLRGRFRPNDEVDRIEWVPLSRVRKRLTYERDADVIDRFQHLVETDALRTFALIAVRHGKAAADSADGSDDARPLTARGRRQADSLGRILSAWSPSSIATSPARRCRETIEPLGKGLGIEPKPKRVLDQQQWEGPHAEHPTDRLQHFLAKRVQRRETAVLCSHSPVIPEVLDGIGTIVGGERDGRLTRSGILSTGEFTVVHLSATRPERGIVALESYAPLD